MDDVNRKNLTAINVFFPFRSLLAINVFSIPITSFLNQSVGRSIPIIHLLHICSISFINFSIFGLMGRPDPGVLRKYSHHYRTLHPVAGGRRWHCLLFLIVLLSLLLIFGYWTFFQAGLGPGSAYLFEQFGQSSNDSSSDTDIPGDSSTENIHSSDNTSSTNSSSSPSFNTSSSTFSHHPISTESHKLRTNLISTTIPTLTTTSPTAPPPPSAQFSNDSREGGNQTDCPKIPPGLIGPIPVWLDAPGFDQLRKLYPGVRAGGHGWPEQCRARHRVAIIVPYRDRETHLRVFLHNMHFLLAKQQLDYAIFIVEQAANQTFNRGKLMNVGFREASRLYDWQCFVFHDVDLLPEDDRNMYSCPEQPRHLSVAVDKFKYRLPYAQIFGGATVLTRKQFERMNGFSNDYWGWGGEDDDISYRITYAGYTISRFPTKIARYKMLKHTQESMNPVNQCRWAILKSTKRRWRRDGLSSLNYTLLDIQFGPLYTSIRVDLLEAESRRILSTEHIKKGC